MLRGFDVSHHNGIVDWVTLKSRYGIAWGAAKATEGRSFQDSQFPANWRKMKSAGLVRMAYHYAHPGGDPSSAALPFLAYVKANGIDADDIMVMDMEANQNNLPLLEVRDWLAGWADIVTRETGRKPFLYCGAGYIANNVSKDLRPHYAAWWFPRYPSAYDGKTGWPDSISGYPTPNNWGVPDIWQFSQSFANSLDANIANMTLADLKTRGTKPTGDVTPTEDDMSAEDVKAINGYTEQVSIQIQKHIDQLIDDIGRSAAAATMALLNTDELAAKIVASLPSGAVDQATVEAGVRAVLKAGTDPSA
jgi:GH25 family lysozyme M1 (1,4-beta-N-acetylmuramidase)